MKTTTMHPSHDKKRPILLAVLVGVTFFAAYSYATGRSAGIPTSFASSVTQVATGLGAGGGGGGCGGGASGGGGGCCGGGGSGKPIEGKAKLANGVQTISVDVSSGYNPNVIKLQAGVPTEITFGQGGGCSAQVQSQQLGFFEDLTSGPKTVKIGPLDPGEYQFTCGMQMITGKIVVEQRKET